MLGNPWLKEEDQIIIDNYLDMTDEELMPLLPNRTAYAIATERKKLRCLRSRFIYTYETFVELVSKDGCTMLSNKSEYKITIRE